ncbi:MAG: transglutaminase domain-containing protein [Euryarchaeota archaeon]|nr:transglutaminase domain-containing protein [Euryarchaeota archaeon]
MFAVLIVGMCLGMCADVPYVFGDDGLQPLDYAQISECDDSNVIEFTDVGGGDGSGAKKSIRVGELKNIFNDRVEPFCRDVRIKALVAAQHSGDRTIYQVCSIYQYLKKGDEKVDGWRYVAGDCDDFAILMSSFMESAGGATRIVLAYNKSAGSGHAYTEIYLGQLEDSNGQAESVINWLKNEHEVDNIYTHINTETKEIWLNLDWGPDRKGSEHPGGPFYHGEKHVIILIRGHLKKAPLKIPPDNLPPSLTGLTPSYPDPQTAGSVVRWTAKASDPNDDTVYYKFWLKDQSGAWHAVTNWTTDNSWTWETLSDDVGDNKVKVQVRDRYHAGSDGEDDSKVVGYTIDRENRPLGHSITNIEFTPTSPADLEFGEYVNITFDYETTEPGGVYIWAEPWTGGGRSPNGACDGFPIYTQGSGSSTGFITIIDGKPVTVNWIHFQMMGADGSENFTLLLEMFVPVDFNFGPTQDNYIHFIQEPILKPTSDMKPKVDLVKGAVEPGSKTVHNKAVELAARSPGPYNIGQICSIDEYLRDNWLYVADPRGIDYYGSASNTLLLGKELDCVGAGDCDDYAILMASILESIGGTTRIILACNGISCHIFTEVYIGPADDDTTRSIVSWLKNKYKCDEIQGHVDQSNGFWLNLDWNGIHPGGPLYSSEIQAIALFRDEYTKTPVNLPPEYRSQA